jgi:putative chitobiose transport system permease protein
LTNIRRQAPQGLSPSRRHLREGERWWASAFVLPVVVIVGVFVFYPIVDTFGISFTDFYGFGTKTFVGFANYLALPANPSFLTALGNSALIAIVVTITLTALPLPIAYWIHRGIPFRRFFRAVYYIPVVLPIVVSSVAWKFLFDQQGFLNWLLALVGLKPIGWLSDPHVAIWSIMIVIVWRSVGIYMLIYLANFLSISDDLFEAAALDGAGGIRGLFSIAIPLMKPSILLCSVVSFSSALKAFDEVFIITNGGPVESTTNASYLIWETAFKYGSFGSASAMAIVLLAIVVIIVGGVLVLVRRKSA